MYNRGTTLNYIPQRETKTMTATITCEVSMYAILKSTIEAQEKILANQIHKDTNFSKTLIEAIAANKKLIKFC